MVIWVGMKTTIEIPDPLFRRAKSLAAAQGQSLKDFVADALQAKLASSGDFSAAGEPQWMAGFGQLRNLREETARVLGVIDEAFEGVEAEDRL
jgi:hypothetical protein